MEVTAYISTIAVSECQLVGALSMANIVSNTICPVLLLSLYSTPKRMLTFSKKADATFSVTGNLNWKKALDRFAKHDALEAVFKVTNADTVMEEQHVPFG